MNGTKQSFEIRTNRADPDLDPGLLYTEWEIESTKDELESQAREIGSRHSAAMVIAGRGPTPRAFQACTAWHAIEIIEQLQLALKRAEERLEEIESAADDRRFD
jgi:hypothetical protein